MCKPSRDGERGSELVEFSLICIPLLGIIFLVIDIAWVYFAQSCLQYAVQTGARYAVTGQTGRKGQDAAIKDVVQESAMGFLSGDPGRAKIAINYYNPTNLSKSLTGSGSNAGGNVVAIIVSGVEVTSFAPLLRMTSPKITLSASSIDVMESSPTSGVPNR